MKAGGITQERTFLAPAEAVMERRGFPRRLVANGHRQELPEPEAAPLQRPLWPLRALLSPSLVLLLVAGCAIGPTYRRPAVNTPETFRGQAAAETASLADLPWWDVLKDDTLASLIRTALTNNYDVGIALARMEQARAVVVQTRAQFFPGLGYQLEASRGRNAVVGNAAPGQNGSTAGAYIGTLNIAWEIDLWGRVRRLQEAALAEYLASDEARRSVVLSLESDVAQAYFELLELDQELDIARRATDSFGESLKVFSDRLQGGVSSRLESSRAEAALAETAATIPGLERQIALKENQLCILLGSNPGPIPRKATLLRQEVPAEIPAGLPSALLERRPDVRRAEQLLRAANARIGVAMGDFLPHIGLTALFGAVSPELSTISSSSARAWALTANVTGPLFQGGRLAGRRLEVQQAWEEARLTYRQTALNAFREVADALVARGKLAEERAMLERAVSAYQEAVKVSVERYTAGRAGYFEVLEAQQQLLPAENALARTQLNQVLTVVQLYKALGGGWEEDSESSEDKTGLPRHSRQGEGVPAPP